VVRGAVLALSRLLQVQTLQVAAVAEQARVARGGAADERVEAAGVAVDAEARPRRAPQLDATVAAAGAARRLSAWRQNLAGIHHSGVVVLRLLHLCNTRCTLRSARCVTYLPGAQVKAETMRAHSKGKE